MSSLRTLKQKLSNVARLWEEEYYDEALAEVEALLESWPGNPHLHVLKASLVQLQDDPKYDLEEVKQALQRAVELDKESPTASIELGHYLDNVEAYCNKERLKDPITEEELEPDEKLMRSIEEQIGISENAKNTFRQEILIRISSHARKGKPFEYRSHERLKEAIEKKIFSDLKDVVKITTSVKQPDADQLRRINEVIDRLVSQHGYCTNCANELLTYVGTLLAR